MTPQREREKQHLLEARRSKVAELYFGGMRRFNEIARELGVHKSVVSRDWQKLVANWKERFVDQLNEYRLQQVAELESLAVRYLAAWEDSRRPTVTQTVEDIAVKPAVGKRRNANHPWTKNTRQTRTTAGDPRFLDGYLKCHQEICKILGLYASEKQPQTTPCGPPTIDLTPAEEDQLILAALARFGLVNPGGPPEGPEESSECAVPAITLW